MTAQETAVMGKKYGIGTITMALASNASATPKEMPGQMVGSKTPKLMPTADAVAANTYRATMANCSPTGTKRGSK